MPSRRPIVVYLAAAFMVVSAVSALMSFLFPSPWTGGLDGALEDTVALIRSWGAWGVVGSIGLVVAHSFVPFPRSCSLSRTAWSSGRSRARW
jgi:hypothetical protein